MVVGRQGEQLSAPRLRTARAVSVSLGGRRCAVAPATPLAVLLAVPVDIRLKDFGSCSSTSAADSGGLFVKRVEDQQNVGSDGWVYKVGSRAGTAGAADPQGSFGNGQRLRTGQRVLWFWCLLGAKGCQRTLQVRLAARTVAPGAAVTVTVTGHDDQGQGVPVAGAQVMLGSATTTTDAAGRARLTAPPAAGAANLRATAPGAVRSFPERIVVEAG